MINLRMTNMSGYITDCQHACMSVLHYYNKNTLENQLIRNDDECLSFQHAGCRSRQISVNSKPVWSPLLVPDTVRSYLNNKPGSQGEEKYLASQFQSRKVRGIIVIIFPQFWQLINKRTDMKGLESNILFMTYLQQPNVLLPGSSSSQEKQAFKHTGLWVEQSRSKPQQ